MCELSYSYFNVETLLEGEAEELPQGGVVEFMGGNEDMAYLVDGDATTSVDIKAIEGSLELRSGQNLPNSYSTH